MKSPASLGRGSGAGETVQLEMFERPAFSPSWPKHATKLADALDLLLSGKRITHRDFIDCGGGWRLAAYIHELKKDLGWWPIEAQEIPAPSVNCPTRAIAEYRMPEWVLQELEATNAR